MVKKIHLSSILFTILIMLFLIFFSQVNAQTITVSGNVYQDEGLTPMTDGITVWLSAEGDTGNYTDLTALGDGAYTITNVPATSGTILTAFLASGPLTVGNTVTVASGSNINDLDIYQNHVIARSDQGSWNSNCLTITHMANYDKDQNSTNMLFDADTVGTHTLTVDAGNEFYIWGSTSTCFYPRWGFATVDVEDIKILGTYFTNWTRTSTYVAGSWTNSGTYNCCDDPDGTFPEISTTFDADQSGTITSGGDAFYNLTFSLGAPATYTLEDDLEVDNDLTITGGILDTHPAESNSINVEGNWTISGTGVFIARNGIVTFDDDRTGTHTITSGGSAFYNLNFSPSASATFISYVLEDDLEVDNDLTITVGILDTNSAESNTINVEGSWTNSGTAFIARNGTVIFDDDQSGTHTITPGGSFFYNLTFSPSASATYTLEDYLEVNNDLTITGGILDTKSGENNSINVEGVWTNSGTFIARNGTVTFDDDQSGTHTITSGGSTFYNLTFSPSASATYILEDAIDVNNNMVILSGTLDTKSGENNSMNVAANWTNYGTFIANSGIVTFDGDQPRTIMPGNSAFYNLTFSPSAPVTYTLQMFGLDVDNDLTITAGILDTHPAESNTINVAGDWTNSGIFVANSGIVTFDGAVPQTVTTGGSNWNGIVVTNDSAVTFFDKFTCSTFTCSTPGANLNFKYQQTDEEFVITSSGGLNLVGAIGQLISLKRYGNSGRWYINPSGGSWTVSYVDVENSYNSHATYINPSNSTNSGNNYNWFTQVTTTSTTTTTPATTTTTPGTATTTTTPGTATTTTTPGTATTTTTPGTATTTTTPTSTTTTQPSSCEVVITPSSETVGFEQTLQFSASTACDGESIAGIYIWDVESLIGSTIDDNGLYKAGTAEGEDTVIATDIENDNVFDTSMVVVVPSIEVSPSEVLRLRWVPLLALMSIKGSETNFELLKTSVDYDTTSVLQLPPLILTSESILQLILVMPCWLNNVWEDEPEVKVTVTTDSEVAVGSIDLKMLPEPLDEEQHKK